MKRIFQIAAILFFGYFLLLLFWDYSNLLENTLNKNVIKVEMKKNSNMTNQEYIAKVKDICKKTDTSLYYRMYNEKTMKYYIVDENHNFFDINLNEKIDKNQYLTTKGTSGHQMNYIAISKVCELRKIDEIETYKLDTASFYIKTKKYNSFEDQCENNNISVEKLEMVVTGFSAVNFENMMIAMALMALVFIMYSLSIKRNVLIRRMSGFNDKDNFLYSLKYEMKLIGIPCACLFFVLCGGIAVFYRWRVVGFIEYVFPYILKLTIIVFIIFVIEKTVLCSGFDISLMKGKREKKYIFGLICFMELMLTILSCSNINTNFYQIKNLYNVYNNYRNNYDTLDKYVACSLNTSNTRIDDNNQLEYNAKFEKFYQETVEKFDGLLIETRNYRSVYGEESNYEINRFDNEICVNDNYINKENIYDVNGKKITSASFKKNKYNILIPSSITKEEYLEKYYYDDYKKEELNIISYKENTKFKSYQVYSSHKQDIMDPVVEIYNEKYKKDQMLNYISGGYYLMKVNDENPYEELVRYLEKYDLDKVVPETPYVKNSFSEYMAVLTTDISNYAVLLFVYIMGWIATVLFAAKEFEAMYGKEIFVKLTSGYSKKKVYQRLWLVQLSIMMIAIVWMNYKKMSFGIVVGVVIVFVGSLLLLLKNNKIKELERIWEL